MITQDTIDKIQELKERRYSQAKVARELHISMSTVARYWQGEKDLSGGKAAPKKFVLDDLFHVGKCQYCDLVYPMPTFMPYWLCPKCKKQSSWSKCLFE